VCSVIVSGTEIAPDQGVRMDLRLFFAVIWRFKWVTGAIALLGVALAVLAYGQPSFAHGSVTIKPRGTEVWQSQSEILVTQAGFPYGRAQQQYAPGSARTGTPAVPVGDLNYMATLAALYASLANGDVVQQDIHEQDPTGIVSAASIENTLEDIDLPLVQFTATAPTSAGASQLADVAATTLEKFVTNQQSSAGIAHNQRAELQLVQSGTVPTLVRGHKMTLSILILFAALAGASGLAFILESARPRTAPAVADDPAPAPASIAQTPPRALTSAGEPADWDDGVSQLETIEAKELAAVEHVE